MTPAPQTPATPAPQTPATPAPPTPATPASQTAVTPAARRRQILNGLPRNPIDGNVPFYVIHSHTGVRENL